MLRRIGLVAALAVLASLALRVLVAAEDAPALPEPDRSWRRAVLASGPGWPDLSHLNHRPAGRLGRVRAEGERLVFGDGSEARFWGANIQAWALFRTEPAEMRRHARRLASLGFNLVRIHHHDSPWVRPNVFGDRAPRTTELHAPSMARLDRWIAALKAEGIYVWLDLHVGRHLTAQDGIADFAEIADGEPSVDLRGYNFVNASIEAAMAALAEAYLGHVNAETGLAYKDDPAILAVLVTNENDATHHFGNRLLPDKGVPAHSARYMALAEAFAERTGLDRDQTWRSWTHGPSKLFLNDLEHRFGAAMVARLREIGYPGLVASGQTWGGMTLAGLPSLIAGDLIDVHSYGQPFELGRDPREAAGMLDWIAAAQVAGLPLTVSEWNLSPFPAADRAIAPLRLAATASLQGWDAMMVYGYAQSSLSGRPRTGNWHIATDPAMLATMPAAALLFRQAHVAPAEQTYALAPPAEAFFGEPISPGTSAAIRTLTEQSRLVVALPETPALPWLRPEPLPEGAIRVADPVRSFLGRGAGVIRSDTGEIARDVEAGILTVDTPRSQAVAGMIGGERLALADLEVAVDTPLAVVAVTSLDGQPIRGSERLLVTVAARSVPLEEDAPPYLTEPVTGRLRIRAPAGLQLARLSDGEARPLPHRAANGWHVIDLSVAPGVQWLLLSRGR